MKPELIVIAGPTASGKTACAVELCGRIGGEVISADSMQVYRYMDIGSAKIKPEETEVVEYTIKPMRRQSKAKTDNVLGIKHKDLVEYTYKNGETHRGYVTALYPELNALNFQSKTKHCKKVNAKKCKLLWKFNKIYWLKCA